MKNGAVSLHATGSTIRAPIPETNIVLDLLLFDNVFHPIQARVTTPAASCAPLRWKSCETVELFMNCRVI